jgi:basic amino acid/polyamine antiporter, APA family
MIEGVCCQGRFMLKKLYRTKSRVANSNDVPLKQVLTAVDLTLLGIGVIIGAGIFVITGVAAATKAGPAIIFSYVLAGMASLFAALCYAELVASIGGIGSAYSFSYATFGELIAWFIGWNLLLEYIAAAGTVAIGWAAYVNNFLQSIHIHLAKAITNNPFNGGYIDLMAVLIVMLLTFLLCVGIKESTRFNAAMVMIKLMTIVVFIIVALFNVNVQHWHPFLPFGWSGVITGASLVFFAYIGFDALSTAFEETIEPQRNIPIGIIASFLICTLLYLVVAGLLTLIVPYSTLNVASPVADALLQIGHPFAAALIAAGAIAGLTTVILVLFYGATRIILAIARDHLLPPYLSYIHPKTHTPIRIILIVGAVIAGISGFVPLDYAAELVNIGTLTAFIFVCFGVFVLRITKPQMKRPFKTPLYPLVPLLGIASCFYLMLNLSGNTWWRFLIWTIIGIAIYFSYGYRQSTE